jgi:outer membrane protein OmpA-like peptidoglycan-associated protein
MTGFDARRSTAAFGAAVLMLIGSGCATKKHVRQVVGPVEARVSQAERTNQQQQAAIGELGNSVARADEHAQDADKKAQAAGDSAKRANDAAGQANQAAQSARARADEGYSMAESTRSRLGQITENLDNYKLVSSENVLFNVNRFVLTKEAQQTLDNAVAQLQNSKNYVLEIEGFTDATGSAANNLELSRKRADSVVRYLTTQHNVPLRKINVLGLGEDDPNADNKTRAGRKQARRVEVRVFALDLNGQGGQGATSTGANVNMPRTTVSGSSTTPATTGTSTPRGTPTNVQ